MDRDSNSDLVTYHVSNVGGGIPSIEIARAIAVDVYGYGLSGHGYGDDSYEANAYRAKRSVTIEDSSTPGVLLIWIAGRRKPSGSIFVEFRCRLCHQTIPI